MPDIVASEEDITKRVNSLRSRLESVKGAVAPGATDEQLSFFAFVCTRLELDPFKDEIYWSSALKKPIIGKRGHLKYATKDPNFVGVYSYVIRSTDEMDFSFTEDGPKWSFRPNMKNRGQITGAFAVGYNKRWKYPLIRFADIKEFDKGGSSASAWTAHKETMIRKVPESAILETMFYEMGYADLEREFTTGEEVTEDSPPMVREVVVDAVEDVDAVKEESVAQSDGDCGVEYGASNSKSVFIFPRVPGAKYIDLDRVSAMKEVYKGRDVSTVKKLYEDLVTAINDRGLGGSISSIIAQVAGTKGLNTPDMSFTEHCRVLLEEAPDEEKAGTYLRLAEVLGFTCGDPNKLEVEPYRSLWGSVALPIFVAFVNEFGEEV